ncbi:hypothetical protein T484DRAFT_1768352 [Baffinella frigidus]|nr:hypothetical protein T484DRAFT_1768352 [Cryptophyta sp. CCMP2293]
MPGSSFVTVGDTGVGKSTLLNAILGEASVLPTNGMRACTACIIEEDVFPTNGMRACTACIIEVE